MSAARSESTDVLDVLVLASADSRDDKIVTLLSAELGRVPAVARYARKSKKRFGGNIEPLTHAEVAMRVDPGRNLTRLDGAWARETFSHLKADLVGFGLGSAMAEVVLRLVPEHGVEPGFYDLLLRAWRYLDETCRAPESVPTEDLLLLFELRALALSGLLPELDALPALTSECREVLGDWLGGHWRPLPPDARRTVANVLEPMVCETSGRPLKSRRYLDGVLPP